MAKSKKHQRGASSEKPFLEPTGTRRSLSTSAPEYVPKIQQQYNESCWEDLLLREATSFLIRQDLSYEDQLEKEPSLFDFCFVAVSVPLLLKKE